MADSIEIRSTATGARPLWAIHVHDDGTFSGWINAAVVTRPWSYDPEDQERNCREVSRLANAIAGAFHQQIQQAMHAYERSRGR